MTTPALAYDRSLVIARARRLRGAATAALLRDLLRWASIAAR